MAEEVTILSFIHYSLISQEVTECDEMPLAPDIVTVFVNKSANNIMNCCRQLVYTKKKERKRAFADFKNTEYLGKLARRWQQKAIGL